MPGHLITPLYLTLEFRNWDGSTFQSVPFYTNATSKDVTITGSNRSIRWDACDSYDQAMVHDLIMGYDARNGSLNEATAISGFTPGRAYQVINYGGTIVNGDTVVGLTHGATYTAAATVNGTEYPITITHNGTDSYEQLRSKIQNQLNGSGSNISLVNGNYEIRTTATGAGQIVEIFDNNLFSSIAGFIKFEDIRVGVTTVGDIFDLNLRDRYQTYTELLIGKLRDVPNKTLRSAKSTTDTYFNHGTGTWLNLITDTP